jgi:mono/diheme cytochrome c family protein
VRRAATILAVVVLAGCGGEDEKRPAAPAGTPGAAGGGHPGLRLWVAQGCGTCHTLEAGGSHSEVGPPLDESLEGEERAYVIESIVAPSAKAAEGYEVGLMPENYAERMSREEIDRLVDFILAAR